MKSYSREENCSLLISQFIISLTNIRKLIIFVRAVCIKSRSSHGLYPERSVSQPRVLFFRHMLVAHTIMSVTIVNHSDTFIYLFIVISMFMVASDIPSHFHFQDSQEIVQCGCGWLYDIHMWKWGPSRALIPRKEWKLFLLNQWWQVYDKDHEEGWSKSMFFFYFILKTYFVLLLLFTQIWIWAC